MFAKGKRKRENPAPAASECRKRAIFAARRPVSAAAIFAKSRMRKSRAVPSAPAAPESKFFRESTMELLRVENLCKTYGEGENLVKALDGVSFSVEKREFVAVIGPSGSGKSTLLHILGGVDRPTSGKVFLDGADVYSRTDEQLAVFRRRQVGLIYQFYNLIPVLTVTENITLPVRLDGREVNPERLKELITVLKLNGRENHLPNQLSGGQQQRVSIGRALMNAPAVVLADEPTGNLDSVNSQEIVSLLKESNRKYGQTLIVITHDENIALQAGRILAIEDGKIKRDERLRG